MAPKSALRGTRKPRENQYIFDLGVKGRKTGLTLPDTGIRDENGLEPMDHLFSSPEKPDGRANGVNGNTDGTISSDDMDVGESTVPEPNVILNERQSMRMPPPRSKSPIKTFLQSPARRNRSLGPASSPIRGAIASPKAASVTASVRRKLDFSVGDLEANTIGTSGTNESPQKRTSVASSKVAAKFTNSTKQSALQPSTFDNEDEEDGREQMEDDAALDNGGESFQIANDDYEEDVEQSVEEHSLPEPETQPARRGRGRPKQKGKGRATESTPEPELDVEHEPETELEDEAALAIVNKAARNGRGKTRKEPPVDGEDTSERTVKRARRSLEGAESAANPSEKSKLDNRSKATKIAPTTKPKINSKKSKLAPVSEAESPDIQRGPPFPRNNRGLFIMRRETPFEGNGFKQTRYGRNSVKPVAWWKNERIEYSEDEADDGTGKFLLSRIKEVVRKDEVEDARPKRTYYRPSKKGKKRPAAGAEDDDDDDEVEPWESNPGRIYGAVREWDPLDEVGAEVPEQEQEVAWSSAAIITKDVAGATFKFAKCLSIPFFGAGMMDVPVGGRKKPKNSRKMQMVFFVYTGRVQVTVNSGEPFRISKGGMWQVPRANFYSIYNDGKKPARIFFAQGCEIEAPKIEDDE